MVTTLRFDERNADYHDNSGFLMRIYIRFLGTKV